VHLERTAKMEALGRLATLGGAISDLNVREPSLEDVFFGFAD
ncbi:MAG: ABC transporter ATP-binding protein, partial [Zoogloea sp.]|nr:ABC transporter ATP-binding protein [Zoogloea sp.]